MDFIDVYYQPGENPVFSYRSGLMVHEETLFNGVLASCGFNGAGYPLNVLSNCNTRLNFRRLEEPSAFTLEIDGQSMEYGLEFADFATSDTPQGKEAVLTLTSRFKPVRIKVHTLLDGTAMFERFLEIENTGSESLLINRLAPLAGGVEFMSRSQYSVKNGAEELYDIGYCRNDGWGHEGELAWQSLRPGCQDIDTRYGRQRHRHPMLFIRNNLSGYMYFVQTAFSGGCRFSVDFDAFDESEDSTLCLRSELTGHSPLLVLRAGETYKTPSVHMGVMLGGLDDCVNEMHTHCRRSVLNLPEADGSALLVGAGMGAEHDMSVETSKDFMRQFAAMGGEVFIIDAGWQNPPHREMEWGDFNGVNIPNADRYPNGLVELSDYCHSLGMKFAMWVEIERLGKFAPMWDAHPEWRAVDKYGRRGGYIDFTNPEAAAWCESELARIITDYKLDLLRVDYNVGSSEYFSMSETPDGKQECICLRHFEAVYKMYNNLKKRFPDVIFENCAGGGGRTDWGQMKNFNHTWVSDWQKAPHSVTITNGMTIALPPERVDRLFAGMGCHEYGSLDFQMRNTMLTHMTLNVIATAHCVLNEKQMEFIRHSVELYKSFIRGFLPECKVYHHTEDVAEVYKNALTVLEITAKDQTKGAIGVFAMPNHGSRDDIILPRGIDRSAMYCVTLDNSGASYLIGGSELADRGIRVHLNGALTSELVLYEAVDEGSDE